MKSKRANPTYKEPSEEMVEGSLREALQSVPKDIDQWRVIFLPTSQIQRGQNVELERQHQDLPDAWLDAPETILPIVVRSHPIGRKKYRIVDGYHRFEAAMQVGIKGLWAVEIAY